MASLYQRISDGALSVDEITASMERSTAAGGRYFQSMEKQSKTLSGQFSTLKDNASQALGAFAQSSSDAVAGDILPTLNDGLSQITEQCLCFLLLRVAFYLICFKGSVVNYLLLCHRYSAGWENSLKRNYQISYQIWPLF